jgi:MipA family protein
MGQNCVEIRATPIVTSSEDVCEPPMSAKGWIKGLARPSREPSVKRFIMWAVFVVCEFTASQLYAEASDTDAENKFVSGRFGIGAIATPRYSGGERYGAFPVPLAALRFGDYAYIDYWQAGLYVLGNQEKTLGLAIVATPRLGFNARDGDRLSGIMTRKSSVETGLSLDYGSDVGGLSLGYLHDVTGASQGGIVRLLGFRQIEISNRFAVEAFIVIERLDSRVANYYYGVGDNETTASRPFYMPGSATDLNAGLHFNYDFGQKSTILFGYEVTRLGDPITSSPIVERRVGNLFYLGYGWRL